MCSIVQARALVPRLVVAAALLAACRPSPPPAGPAPAPPTPEPAAAAPAQAPAPAAAAVAPKQAPAAPRGPDPELRQPSPQDAPAPERFTVLMETSSGDLNIDVRRSWAPHAADRFYRLVRTGFYDGNAFFRVIDGFIAQIGLNGDPEVNRAWRSLRLADDPPAQSNVRGMVSFAASGRNSRTTQVFINLADNEGLDRLGFVPFGRVRELATASALYAGYGEGAPAGAGPSQARIQTEGNAYLKKEFPRLDYVKRATVVDEKPGR